MIKKFAPNTLKATRKPYSLHELLDGEQYEELPFSFDRKKMLQQLKTLK